MEEEGRRAPEVAEGPQMGEVGCAKERRAGEGCVRNRGKRKGTEGYC